jgi:hypothetical protein
VGPATVSACRLAAAYQALKLNPHHLVIHFAIGELYMDELHWKLAAAEIAKASFLAPDALHDKRKCSSPKFQ